MINLLGGSYAINPSLALKAFWAVQYQRTFWVIRSDGQITWAHRRKLKAGVVA